MKIEDSESFISSAENGRKESPESNLFPLKVKTEIPDNNVDDLDHIVLKERQRMLLSRKIAARPNRLHEDVAVELLEHTNGNVKECVHSADDKILAASNQCMDILGGHASSSDKSADIFMQSNAEKEKYVLPAMNDMQNSSTSLTFIKVKNEPCDKSEAHNLKADGLSSFSFNFTSVKGEQEIIKKNDDDLVDHVCLRDRLKFIMSRDGFRTNSCTRYMSLKDTRPSTFERSFISESSESLSIKLPQKRKKTATDSVQTALEEDAPGLLQVLVDKGVLVDEIKLYGGVESDEALDESFCEDSFTEFEDVLSKLFTQRNSFLKLPPIRASKTSRASYCLPCLISLVEQTRYLQFRKWPVEWGWCRDLQAFIFVFERHNRIVLERPEYGFATYFFELVEYLPILWQIKRLVTVMKLTCCGRISLIENKALRVGEDLTEGEAEVLMEYGWTPNSGVGTMLNYRDRVVHDRKNEKDSSEWRSKIGKLLMDGYNGGTIVPPKRPSPAPSE